MWYNNSMISVNFNPKIDLEKARLLVKEIEEDAMGGWVKLPSKTSSTEIQKIYEIAEKIRSNSKVLISIGIGGSYLGHRAIIEALRPKSEVEIIYAGNSLSKRELDYALERLGERDFSVLVISKSGTTLEPAKAFEVFKKKLAEKYGVAEAAKRVYAITDAEKGELRAEATRDGYTTFAIPDNIGGRYSVLSPVGLLPMAVAGIKIEELLNGAKNIQAEIENFVENEEKNENEKNDSGENVIEEKSLVKREAPAAVKYGFMRHLLRSKNYDTEVFASFEPATMYFNEWLKQLFGESEGKERQGVLPTSVIYSTDLHSLGQFMQDGRRNLWETILNFPTDELNQKVVEAVQKAHTAGGIPVLKIDTPSYDEKGFGELIYFMELACAISAKLQGVNPFDQPGVEAYKNELRKLID